MASAAESPDNTYSPPTERIIDSNGNPWYLVTDNIPIPPLSIAASLLVYCNHRVYAKQVPTNNWYRWTQAIGGETEAGWYYFSPTDPCVPPPTLVFNGMAADRVGQNELRSTSDGMMDAMFTVTVNGTKTITSLSFTNGEGVWDTLPGGAWTLGVASAINAGLYNSPADDSVNFNVVTGDSFKIFASEYGAGFTSGRVFTVTLNFSDGTSTSATTTIP